MAYSPRSKHQGRIILPCMMLVAVAAALAACATPVGTPPSWRNLPLPPTQVTNPDGGGAQVTRWGPPDTSATGRGR